MSFCLIVIVIACALFDRHLPVRPFFTVDDSWSLDLFFKAHQGIWAGKDFAFTYGPLYQWLLGISALGHGFSLGTFFRFGHLGLFAYTVLVVWLTGRLLLRQEASWKRALLIIGFAFPWTYFEVREATILLLFALMLHVFGRALDRHSRYRLDAALGSAAIAFAFLLSGDTGIYGITALLTAAAAYCLCHRRDAAALRTIIRITALMSAGLACWGALIGILLGFQFWRDIPALAGTYRWAMAIPFTPARAKWDLLLVVGICSAVFAAAWWWRKNNSLSLAGKPVFLLAAPLFSLACLQSSLVRSDWFHIFFGSSAAVALAAFSLFAAKRSNSLIAKMRIAGGFALLVLYLFPNISFLPGTIESALAPSSKQCPRGTADLDGVCVENSNYPESHDVAVYLETHSTVADSVAIFPLDNVFGDLARRRVAGGVLQNYVAAGDVLVRRQLDRLEKEQPRFAVYSTDQRSATVSGIPNLTRSPQIWLYLQSHYSAAAEIQPGLLVLRKDEARRQRWSVQFSPLAFNSTSREFAVHGQKLFAVANQIAWPANADLLRIRLLLRYPPWWNLGKPWSVSVVVGRADGTIKRVKAIVPPNREADIWVYPGADAQLGAYFAADPKSWRAGAESPVRSIGLMIQSLGCFSVQPTAIRIDKVEAVTLGPAGRQDQP